MNKHDSQTIENNPEQIVTIQDVIAVIIRHKLGVILFVSISVFITWLQHKSEVPQYYAVSMLMFNNGGNNPVDALLVGSSENNGSIFQKDIVLLTSMPITMRVVQEMNKSTRRDSLEFFGNRHYRSDLEKMTSPFFPTDHGAAVSGLKSNNQNTELPPNLLRSYAMQLSSRIRIQPITGTGLMNISVASPFADEAVYLTNILCKVYKESDIERKTEKYKQGVAYITQMLAEQERIVAQADSILADYMTKNEIYDSSANIGLVLNRANTSEDKSIQNNVESRIAQNTLNFLQSKLTQSERELSNRIAHSVNAKLGTQLDEIKAREKEYIALIDQKGFDATETKTKKQQVDNLKTRYEQLSRSKIAGEISYAGRAQKYNFDLIAEKLETERKFNLLKFTGEEYTRLNQQYESQIKLLPKKQQEFAKLQRNREIVGKTELQLKQKLDDSHISIASEVGTFSIIGEAFRPFTPESSNAQKNMLYGLVIGCFLASIYIAVMEFIDTSIKDDLFFKRNDLPVLAHLPFISIHKQSKKGEPGYQNDVPLITDQLSSWFAESFRTLRTALNYSFVDLPLKSIIISGTAVSEGKSTVCSNLAIAFAINGKKTIIVDCDLRLASQHRIFHIKREPGLADYLFGENKIIDDQYIQPTKIENLFILAGGKKIPNPNEILASKKMQALIKDLEKEYDKVLIDSPPLFLSDAAQLAHSVNGILLTARMNFSDRNSLKEIAIDSYLKSKMLGVVVIGSKQSKRYGYGRYGYGKYGYSYHLYSESPQNNNA